MQKSDNVKQVELNRDEAVKSINSIAFEVVLQNEKKKKYTFKFNGAVPDKQDSFIEFLTPQRKCILTIDYNNFSVIIEDVENENKS